MSDLFKFAANLARLQSAGVDFDALILSDKFDAAADQIAADVEALDKIPAGWRSINTAADNPGHCVRCNDEACREIDGRAHCEPCAVEVIFEKRFLEQGGQS